MGVKFIDNSDKITSLLESAIAEGLQDVSSLMQTQANSGGKNLFKSHVDTVSNSVTVSSDKPEALEDEFGKGEYATGAKGSKRPKRSLSSAFTRNKGKIEKTFADKIKEKLG